MSLPTALAPWVTDAQLTPNTTGYSGDRVTRVEGPAGVFFLKEHTADPYRSLALEAEVLLWIGDRLPVPRPLWWGQVEGREYLLLTEVRGIPPYDEAYRPRRDEVVVEVAQTLRRIHDLAPAGGTFAADLADRRALAARRVADGVVRADAFEAENWGQSADELWRRFQGLEPPPVDAVFTHGDFCLPNVLLVDGRLGGVIDWGGGGVADRYQDLALAHRSLVYNGFTPTQIAAFFEAYGLPGPDRAKLAYYVLLDEFF